MSDPEAPSLTAESELAPIMKTRDSGEPDGDEMDSDERDSFDAYADAAGIPDAKRDSAYAALRALIETCAAKIKDGSYGEE